MVSTGLGRLSVALTTDSDFDMKLRVTAQASGFGGATSLWWGDRADLSRLATEISRYPLDPDRLIELVGRYRALVMTVRA